MGQSNTAIIQGVGLWTLVEKSDGTIGDGG